MIDEQKFFAWLDGELPADEAGEVERQVAADPELRRMADEHRGMAARLRGAFDPIAQAPVPERIASAVREHEKAEVVSLADARARRSARAVRPIWTQVAAMAATLVLGIALGSQLANDSSGPVQADGGRLLAQADLERALSTRLASAPADEGPRIGLTFRDQSGSICRTFEDSAATGLACREGGDWRLRALFEAGEGQGGDYRMAAGADPRLMELVDQSIAGEPFDAAQEKQAKERGWE